MCAKLIYKPELSLDIQTSRHPHHITYIHIGTPHQGDQTIIITHTNTARFECPPNRLFCLSQSPSGTCAARTVGGCWLLAHSSNSNSISHSTHTKHTHIAHIISSQLEPSRVARIRSRWMTTTTHLSDNTAIWHTYCVYSSSNYSIASAQPQYHPAIV